MIFVPSISWGWSPSNFVFVEMPSRTAASTAKGLKFEAPCMIAVVAELNWFLE